MKTHLQQNKLHRHHILKSKTKQNRIPHENPSAADSDSLKIVSHDNKRRFMLFTSKQLVRMKQTWSCICISVKEIRVSQLTFSPHFSLTSGRLAYLSWTFCIISNYSFHFQIHFFLIVILLTYFTLFVVYLFLFFPYFYYSCDYFLIIHSNYLINSLFNIKWSTTIMAVTKWHFS